MKILQNLLFLIIVMHPIAGSSQYEIQWAKACGGTKSDEAKDAIETPDGGCLIVGQASSYDGDVFGNHGLIDILAIKLDVNGIVQWKKLLGGPDVDVAYDVKPTLDGGYILAGLTGSNSGNVSGNHGDFDAWIVKLDALGQIQWQKCFGGSKREEAYNVIPTKDGGYVFVGFSESVDGDLTMNHGFYDAWIVKIDSVGNIKWQRSYGGNSDDRSGNIIQMPDGGFTLIGSASSNDGNVAINYGGYDIWLLRLNFDGKILWQKSYGGSGIDVGSGVLEATDNGFFVFGQTFSLDGQVSENHGISDLWLIKTDSTGAIQWNKCYGGSQTDYPGGIALMKDSMLVLSGTTSSNDGDVMNNLGGYEFWVLSLNASGNIIWNNTYGGSEAEICNSLELTKENSLLLAGYTWSNDGDVSGQHGTYNDYWIIKLSQNTSKTTTPTPRSINLSPNPASTSISLSLPQQDVDYQGEISDASGRVLLRKKLSAGGRPADWDVSTLPSGIYFIQLMDAEGKRFMGRIFKE